MKKPFKVLAKSAKKSRKKNGLTNAVSQAKITIQPEDLKRTNRMMKDATALIGMVNFIREEQKEISEDLDKDCFKATGLRLQDFSDFFFQFTFRLRMAMGIKNDVQRDQMMTRHLDTISFLDHETGEPNNIHFPKEDYEHYIRCYEQFNGNPAEVHQFVKRIYEYAEVLRGGRKIDD